MLNSIDSEARMHMGEASPTLIEPFKTVVENATSRLEGEGEVDSLARKQLSLHDSFTGRLYHLTDVVTYRFDPEDNNSGLFVHGLQLDSSHRPESELVGIQLPRSVQSVSQQSLYHLRGMNPEDADRLAIELDRAEKVDDSVYEASKAEWERMKAVEIPMRRFMDFVVDRKVFDRNWIQAVLTAVDPMYSYSLNVDQLRGAVREGGLPALKAKLLSRMIQEDEIFAETITEAELKAFIAYDPSKPSELGAAK